MPDSNNARMNAILRGQRVDIDDEETNDDATDEVAELSPNETMNQLLRAALAPSIPFDAA